MMAHAVSDGEGATRKERRLGVYEKIRTTPGAKIVKLCDRIANVEFSSGKLGDAAKFKMYQDEYAEFQRQLRDKAELHLEAHLAPSGQSTLRRGGCLSHCVRDDGGKRFEKSDRHFSLAQPRAPR